MTISLAADGAVSLLLVITIFYAAILSRRINALRADKAMLGALVEQIAAAAQNAEAGVQGLRAAADDIGRKLDKKRQDAQSLRDDLAYMIERGTVAADRLEGGVRARRDEPRADVSRQRPVEAPRPQPELRQPRQPKTAAALAEEMAARLAPGTPSRAERNLLRALGGRR
jgi:hypothetical protein